MPESRLLWNKTAEATLSDMDVTTNTCHSVTQASLLGKAQVMICQPAGVARVVVLYLDLLQAGQAEGHSRTDAFHSPHRTSH